MGRLVVYAVVGVWELEPDQAEEQRNLLLSHIVPGVRHAPGLVKGYWAGDVGGRSHSFIVFEDQSSAEQFAASVRGNAAAQTESGVGVIDLQVVPVTAET